MPSLISYDGNQVFAEQADPLISKTTDYIQAGNRWGTLDRISLNGALTGSSFDNIYGEQETILDKFSEDFKTLAVDGFGNFYQCRITNISFTDSEYRASSNYSIDIESYGAGEDTLLAAHGVINPINSISYTEQGDQSVSATRTISAQGVSVGDPLDTPDRSNAVNNAREFISGYMVGDTTLLPGGQSRTGITTPDSSNWVMKPFFAGKPYKNANAPMLLRSQQENFNRFTAEASLTQEYVIDATGNPDFSADYILRFTEDSDSSDDGAKRITIQGSIKGSQYSSQGVSGAFEYYKKFKEDIDQTIINESITQDIKNSSVDFSFEYDKGFNLDIVPAINVSISENSSSSLINVTVNGSVSPKNPDKGGGTLEADCHNTGFAPAYPSVLRYFTENTPVLGVDSGPNPSKNSLWYAHAQAAYVDYIGPAMGSATWTPRRLHPAVPAEMVTPSADSELNGILQLNPVPSSSTVSHDTANAVISFSYTFNDAFRGIGAIYDKPTTTKPRQALELSIRATPMTEVIAETEGINEYIYFDQGYHSLANLNLSINLVGRDLSPAVEPLDDSWEKDLSLIAIAGAFSTPYEALDKEMDHAAALDRLSENRAYGRYMKSPADDAVELERKSYNMSWTFKSKNKLTDHENNGPEKGGYYDENFSKLNV